MRVAVGCLLVVAGQLASCSAGHGRAGTQFQARIQSRGGGRFQSGGRPVGVRAPGHAQAMSGARLQISRGLWWSQSGVTTCGPPALVRAAGHVMGVGTCSGLLSIPSRKVTLAVGQRIDVHITEGGSVGLPHSSAPSVLSPGAVSQDRGTQTYRAARPGHAVLASGAQACLAFRHREVKEIPGSCPVIAVTVVPLACRGPRRR